MSSSMSRSEPPWLRLAMRIVIGLCLARSGDILVMGGAARLIFHGVDKIFPGSSAAGRRANQPDLAAGGAAGRRAGGVRELTRSLECD